MSCTGINNEPQNPLPLTIILLLVITMFFLLVGKLFAMPNNHYSEYPEVMLHSSIRPKEVKVKREPVVSVERYEAPNWKSDPEVLVSLPKQNESEVIVVDHSRIMAEKINQLQKRVNELEMRELEAQAKEITGSVVDDGKVEYQWAK